MKRGVFSTRILFVLISMLAFAGQSFAVRANERPCPSFPLAVTGSWQPLSWKAEDGSFKGIVPELVTLLKERTAIEFEIVEGLPWKRQLHMLENGKLASIAALHFNDERSEKYNLTRPYYSSDIHVFRHKDSAFQYEKLNDLRNHRGVLPLGASFGTEFDAYRRANLHMVEKASTKDMLSHVLKRRADYMILPRFLGNHVIRQHSAQEIVLQTGPAVVSKPIHMAMSKRHVCASRFAAIDAEMGELLDSGVMQQILNKVDQAFTQ